MAAKGYNCKAFYGTDWDEFRKVLFDSLCRDVQSQTKDYILGVSEEEYKLHLVDKYRLGPLVVDLESEDVEPPSPKIIQRLDYGSRVGIEGYCFPVWYRFKGHPELFRVRPPTLALVTTEIAVDIVKSRVGFEVNVEGKSVELFKRKKEELLHSAFANLPQLNRVVEQWNHELSSVVAGVFDGRKRHFLAENDFFAAINVRQNPTTASVFAVSPIAKRKIPQPRVPEGTHFTTEPAIQEEVYVDVLKLLYALGRGLEQKPSLYQGKDEEALRDYMLTFLETRYEGSTATGETFNRSGKTDIILKYSDNTNLFVAECKFWSGAVGLHEAISQLFDRYLTWRDSKTALLLFVQNKNFSNVLSAIKTEVPKHAYFKNHIGDRSESSFTYIFRLPQDKDKDVKLEIMAFHLDK